MKHVLSILLITAFSMSVWAQRNPRPYPPDRPNRPSQDRACSCYELERRIEGMDTVLYQGNPSRMEARQIERQMARAEAFYNSVNFRRDSVRVQEAQCSRGNQEIDRSWERWQPWLARNRLDPGNRCRGY